MKEFFKNVIIVHAILDAVLSPERYDPFELGYEIDFADGRKVSGRANGLESFISIISIDKIVWGRIPVDIERDVTLFAPLKITNTTE